MGYRTGAKMLILFMFAFFLLGYQPFLSICLGAIAGLTSGFIASWWHAKEDYLTDEVTGAELGDGDETNLEAAQRRPVRYGFGVRTARKTRATRDPGESRGARPSRGVGWLFRRNRS
ncbi:MAG: hypothetical protein NW220_13355 [Leptolyngbyaceae cyanobacterium bins.349]|nr:hypothetical protein [Leptolyngbyaceae cyanobacterium bins.349]